MQVMEQADKNYKTGGTSMVNQLLMVQPQGPLAYTTYDFLKQWSWMISFTKFIAHIFSLPLMVFLRKNFGMRYLDEVHIGLSFIIWQFAGAFAVTATSESTISFLVGGLINLLGVGFIPMALYHRRCAKAAALRGEGYSYYPGLPHAFWAIGITRLTGGRFKADQLLIQGVVRRFFEPIFVFALGVVIGSSGASTGFGIFLLWTAIMLNINETFTQREGWEVYLDGVDAQVIAKEKERMLSEGPSGVSLTHGISMAKVASLSEMRQQVTNLMHGGEAQAVR